MKKYAAISLVVFLVAFWAGCTKSSGYGYSSPTAPNPPAAPPNTVVMSASTFSPTTLTVSVGTTVTWQNDDSYAHTSTSDNGVWDTGNIAARGSAKTTFNTAGTFPYHCIYHVAMGMKGTIVVK